MIGTATPGSHAGRNIDSLTIFSWVWAAQSLIQMVFFTGWIEDSPVQGWIFCGIATAVLLFPGRLWLFVPMLVASLVAFISQWPFVANHVYLDSFMTVTMLLALAIVVWRSRENGGLRFDRALADRWLLKFAPVCGAIFAFMYFAIIISKLNEGFFDLEISCLSGMIEEAQAHRPLISGPLSLFSVEVLFWVFIVAEAALPLMLAIRRTRLLAYYFGVPFHILLGLMGHWTFSSFMLSFYVLVAMPSFRDVVWTVAGWVDAARQRIAPWVPGPILFALGVVAVLVTGALFKPSWVWLIVASTIAAGLLWAAVKEHLKNGLFGGTGVMPMWTRQPGLLWAMLALAVINSASPYLGFKTSTNVAMYSNMRTEGNMNNHLFLPMISLFDYQDDLIDIIETNSPEIDAMRTQKARYGFEGQEFEVLIPYFELRRAVSASRSPDLEITYIRDGTVRTFRRGASDNVDASLDVPPNAIIAKLAHFRPVFKGERSYCLH